MTVALPADVKTISWAAERLGIGQSTAYRLAAVNKLPGAFKIGAQWRVSVPRFEREVHGSTGSRPTESRVSPPDTGDISI